MHHSWFHTGFSVREGKEMIMWSTLLLWGSGSASPGYFLKFRLCEVASGDFWGPKRLVAKMLLYIEIHLAWNVRGGIGSRISHGAFFAVNVYHSLRQYRRKTVGDLSVKITLKHTCMYMYMYIYMYMYKIKNTFIFQFLSL